VLCGSTTVTILDCGSRVLEELPSGSAPGTQGRLLHSDPERADFASPVDGSRHTLTPVGAAEDAARLRPTLAITGYPPRPPRGAESPELDRAWAPWAIRSAARLREADLPCGIGVPRWAGPGGAAVAAEVAASTGAVAIDSGAAAVALGADEGRRPALSLIAHWDGTPAGLAILLACGIDVVVSPVPARLGLKGFGYAAGGWVDIRQAFHARRADPLVPGCWCPTCQGFSAAYIHHLFAAEELLGYRLLVAHNIWWATRLVAGVPLPAGDAEAAPVVACPEATAHVWHPLALLNDQA
jgi:queuine tRNA-ribosyltransferase